MSVGLYELERGLETMTTESQTLFATHSGGQRANYGT